MATSPDAPPPVFNRDLFQAYEDGKHRRYTLLFTVNGGAFAVAKLLGEKGGAVAGNLTLCHLAIGMIAFTAVMCYDIAEFGRKMRRIKQPPSGWTGPFGWPGRIVLVVLGLLIGAGWLLVALGDSGHSPTEVRAIQTDIKELTNLNEQINNAENKGDVAELEKFIASELAFQRRDGSIVNRKGFLTPRPGNRVIRIESVHVWGDRAVVACVVTDAGLVTHNIRLFVRVNGEWKLLGWANEPA